MFLTSHPLNILFTISGMSQMSVQNVRKICPTDSIAQVSEAGSALRHSPVATHDSDSWPGAIGGISDHWRPQSRDRDSEARGPVT